MAFGIKFRSLLMGLGVVTLAGTMFAQQTGNVDSLSARGLAKVGSYWCLPEEPELRDRLADLEHLEKRYREARQTVDQLLDQNEQARIRLTQLIELEKKAKEAVAAAQKNPSVRKPSDADLKRLTASIEEVQRSIVPLEKLGTLPPLKLDLVELVNLRIELAIKFFAIRGPAEEIARRYERLRQDQVVQAAMPADEQLGPTKTLQEKRKIFEKVEAIVLDEKLPVAREGKAYRVTALVNDHRPLTFSYVGADEKTVIPQALAEAAGVTASEQSSISKYRVGPGREVEVRAVTIPQLRFGRSAIRDVKAYLLPPEASDIGARLGTGAVPGYRPKLDVNRLQLTILGPFDH